VPIFAVGTERDHVAPWRSTYKIHLLTDTEVTYLLTTGGHNVGIVSEPNGRGRSFRVMTKNASDHYVDPTTWLVQASQKQGSWWAEWAAWLNARSREPIVPPNIGGGIVPLGDAPGSYVLQE
jgi:polyhydroxyalkanoate synthase